MRNFLFSLVFLVVGYYPSLLADSNELVITTHIEEIPTPLSVIENIENNFNYLSQDETSRDGLEPTLDLIVNLGKQIWEIIKENQPVVDVKYQYANALPMGVQSGMDLQGFSPLQYKSYRISGTNTFGVTVYDITLTAIHQFGGNYKGKGRYLETVTVLPEQVSVKWGYTVSLAVTRVSATNVGSSEDPVANLIMETELKVSTVVQHDESRQLFEFRGDSPDIKTVGLSN